MSRRRKLDWHTVLITGSSRGLGKELAKVFSHHGYRVITHGRKGDVNILGDLRDDDVIKRLVEISKKNNLEVLINNAGILCPGLALEKIRDEQIEEMLSTNLIAPLKLIRGIYPFFVKREYGVIININSRVALRESFRRSVYSASKGGLRGFSLGLRKEAKEKGIEIIDFYLGKIENAKIVAENIYRRYEKIKDE